MQVSEQIALRSEAAFKGISMSTGGASAKVAERKGVASEPFHTAKHAEHVRLMFEVCWMPILAGISAPLQEADVNDLQTVQTCMLSFRCAIHLSSIFDVETARNAFTSTLTKYAFINSSHDFLFRQKHVESIRAVLDVAIVDGNWLKAAWLDVLRCISQLERIMNSAAKDNDGVMVPGVSVSTSDGPRDRMGSVARQRPVGSAETDPIYNRPLTAQEDMQAEAVAQSLLVCVDRIFTSSVKLSGVCYLNFGILYFR